MSSGLSRKVSLCGIFVSLALMLSYLESFVPVGFFAGVPGFKLGFANIAVLVVYFSAGPYCAAAVSLIRIIVSSVLFGSVTTFWFSLSGGLLSFAALVLLSRLYPGRVGMIGISVVCAAMHNTGQIAAAAVLMKTASVFGYLPYLLLLSVPCGIITGAVSAALFRHTGKIAETPGRRVRT